MDEWRFNHGSRRGHGVRAALACAVAGICALVAYPAPVLAAQFKCTAEGTAVVLGSGINVQCQTGADPNGEIYYFVLNIANPEVSRVLSLTEAAVVTGRPLVITYDPNDLTGAAIGCLNSNCRLIQIISLERQ